MFCWRIRSVGVVDFFYAYGEARLWRVVGEYKEEGEMFVFLRRAEARGVLS